MPASQPASQLAGCRQAVKEREKQFQTHLSRPISNKIPIEPEQRDPKVSALFFFFFFFLSYSPSNNNYDHKVRWRRKKLSGGGEIGPLPLLPWYVCSDCSLQFSQRGAPMQVLAPAAIAAPVEMTTRPAIVVSFHLPTTGKK